MRGWIMCNSAAEKQYAGQLYFHSGCHQGSARRLQHPKRNAVGLRIPDHPVALALLEELGEPLLSSTLILPGEKQALNDAEEIRDRLDHQLDLVLDGGATGLEPTTVIDLTGVTPLLMRRGKGDVAPFEIES